MRYEDEDYDLLAYEVSQLCSFLRGLGLDDTQIGDQVINGTPKERGYAYDTIYGLAEIGFKEKISYMDSDEIFDYTWS